MDGSKPLFGFSAFVYIQQMPVLKWDLLIAVLDFKNAAAVFSLVIDHHIKFTGCELQLENAMIRISGLHGFQQDNVLHHPPPDFFLNPIRNPVFLIFAES